MTVQCNLPYEFGTKVDVILQDTQEYRGEGVIVGYVVYDDDIEVLVGNPRQNEEIDYVTGKYSMAEIFPVFKSNAPLASIIDFPKVVGD